MLIKRTIQKRIEKTLFKGKKDRFKVPKVFSGAYPEVSITLVNRGNFGKFSK